MDGICLPANHEEEVQITFSDFREFLMSNQISSGSRKRARIVMVYSVPGCEGLY